MPASRFGPTRFMSIGHASKLTEKDVAHIKWLLGETDEPGVAIAVRFGVSKSMISKINAGERWGWVDPLDREPDAT